MIQSCLALRSMEATIRFGMAEDASDMLKLIKELALFEKEPNEVIMTEEMLINDGFGKHPKFQSLVAELNGEIVGVAIYYPKYSTWKGECLFLEDLIVTEKCRGQKIGEQLLKKLTAIAFEKGMQRLEWQVLDWNEVGINFYKKCNASLDPTWINVEFSRDEMYEFIN